jgi:hypothetical protein
MGLLNKLKRFWVRIVLGQVFDPEEVLSGKIKSPNTAEVVFMMDILYREIQEIHKTIDTMVYYVAEVPTPCDKCDNYIEPGSKLCFKCEGSGIIKNKQLCNWPW